MKRGGTLETLYFPHDVGCDSLLELFLRFMVQPHDGRSEGYGHPRRPDASGAHRQSPVGTLDEGWNDRCPAQGSDGGDSPLRIDEVSRCAPRSFREHDNELSPPEPRDRFLDG